MAVFRRDRQAARLIKKFDRVGKPRVGPAVGDTRDRNIYSIRTRAIYLERAEAQAEYVYRRFHQTLDRISSDQARQYLEARAAEVGRERLSQERCALMLHPHLRPFEREFASIRPVRDGPGRLATVSRVLMPDEPPRIMTRQGARNAFSTELAYKGGLRASELLTLRRLDEREPTPRTAWDDARFSTLREPVFYTVQGKGGLVRTVAFEQEVADRIKQTRLAEPKKIKDRGVTRIVYYDLAGGNAWSKSFERASKAALGESLGAHSCRHTYAQAIKQDLENAGHTEAQALELTSQTLGHFRPKITQTYMR